MQSQKALQEDAELGDPEFIMARIECQGSRLQFQQKGGCPEESDLQKDLPLQAIAGIVSPGRSDLALAIFLMSESQNKLRTEPRPNCFLCDLPGKPLYTGRPSALFDTPGQWSFSKCSRTECGLIWINPCPIESDLHIAYQNYFTHGGPATGASARLRGLLYSLYRAANFPIWVITGVAREKARRQQMLLEHSRPGRLLDVGCGDGTFLNLMRSKGWEVDGVDFDPKAIQTAKQKYNLTLRHGDLISAALPAESFDAVTMSHVVEHLADPIGLLVEIRRVLKVGGRLVVTTPNTDGIGHRKFGPDWFGIDAPRHLHLFCRGALSELIRRAGLETVWLGSTSANADVFIGASYTINENNRHRMGHQPAPSMLRTLKAAWWQLREHFAMKQQPDCGEELVAICTRK